MGADLTIVKDETYFRDSYNQTNILWRFGLSYWGLDKEIPALGKIGARMTFRQVKVLRKELARRVWMAERFYNNVTEKWLKEHNCNEGVAGWVDFWRKKQVEFFKFFDHAIELKSGIRWSV